MRIIIFDFEVFEYDVLLGTHIFNDDNIEVKQSWDLKEIRRFYEEHIDDIWIGHRSRNG